MRIIPFLICSLILCFLGTAQAQNPSWTPQPSPWSEPENTSQFHPGAHSIPSGTWNPQGTSPLSPASGWSQPIVAEPSPMVRGPVPVMWPTPNQNSYPSTNPYTAPVGYDQLRYDQQIPYDQSFPSGISQIPTAESLGITPVLPTTYSPYHPTDPMLDPGNSPRFSTVDEEAPQWWVMPRGLMYKSYLAGPRESRFMSSWFKSTTDEMVWDATLGGKMGLLRYGYGDALHPRGFQIDMEGAVFTRLDPDSQTDLDSADFRFGVPLTWRNDQWQLKFGYYHISSHIGDEYLVSHPGFVRDNYVREAVNFGVGYFPNPDLRLYAEAGYPFTTSGAADEWEYQLGMDYSPLNPVPRGTPFAALNLYMREEVNFEPGITLQTGWQWLGADSGSLLRVGLHIYSGKTYHFSFVRTPNRYEKLAGFAIWYDF